MSNQTALGKLSDMELEVMREVWAMAAPVTVARVLEIFTARHGWKTSTLSTMLDRLIEKGYLTKTMHGKVNIYVPVVTEAVHKEHETRNFLKKVHNGSVKSFIAALADGTGMSAEELTEIRRWFREEAGSE